MFKRVTKKQKKREELEELGLSDIANDDSSGSDTSSGDPSDSEEDNAPEDDEQPGGSVEGSEDGQDGEPDEDEEGSDADEDEFDDDPPMTIEEAKANPIYKASDETAFHECIVCPSKKLKHEGIVSEHLNSSSHKRRFERFLETTKDTTFGTDDPRLIVAAITTLTHNPPSLTSITGVLSNRGKKRKEKMDKIRKMRATQKEMKAKAIRKRDAKRAVAALAVKNGTEGGVTVVAADKAKEVTKKASKEKGKDKDVDGPAKKKRKVSEGTSQDVDEYKKTPKSSEGRKKDLKAKSVVKVDAPSSPSSLPKPTKETKTNSKTKETVEPVSSEHANGKSKPKKRKRPTKTKSSE